MVTNISIIFKISIMMMMISKSLQNKLQKQLQNLHKIQLTQQSVSKLTKPIILLACQVLKNKMKLNLSNILLINRQLAPILALIKELLKCMKNNKIHLFHHNINTDNCRQVLDPLHQLSCIHLLENSLQKIKIIGRYPQLYLIGKMCMDGQFLQK